MKKEGWGGGTSRVVVFQRGQGDLAQLKQGGKTLTISVGDGLPKSSSESKQIIKVSLQQTLSYCSMLRCFNT